MEGDLGGKQALGAGILGVGVLLYTRGIVDSLWEYDIRIGLPSCLLHFWKAVPREARGGRVRSFLIWSRIRL